MKLKEFENMVDEHSLLPGNNLYNSNALCGEAGELANISKKIEIFALNPDWIADKTLSVEYFKAQELDELGDVLFYLIRKIHDTGLTIEEIMDFQRIKLVNQTKKYGRIFKK